MPAAADTAGRSAVSAALAVRRWAWAVFFGEEAGEAPGDRAGWELFLRVERCALPLHARLGDSGATRLPPEIATLLRQRAGIETQRVLSARAGLALISRAAASLGGAAVVVLKGGVVLTPGAEPLDLADVDVLLEPGAAGRLGEALDASGYQPYSHADEWHARPRIAPGAVPVEIHTGLPPDQAEPGVLERAVALPGWPALRRPAPLDHAWHLLVHSALHHPLRRGGLRDLLLLAAALRECTADEVEEIGARAGAHRFALPLGEVLEAGRALAAGTPGTDCFGRIAAAAYGLQFWTVRLRLPPWVRAELALTVVPLVGAPADRSEFRALLARNAHGSHLPPLAWAERRVPRLGAALRTAVRGARYAFWTAAALPLAAGAGRAAARVPSGARLSQSRTPC
ncbi:nucleotidyltransferase family protein [Longimicrobium sp.]|uniref:nucleotidyltransferase family protein n=1 Tax=Longimicrobium sp. TaxID=2029185 RepID=UPI002B7F0C9A|nr:nucleotidyltransferase family protein [Longimicrobium sp.]HSU17103.1 nucleotidyltransferase family protein [Longimicrobium sp.]